jgi:hypothetical protein
LSGRALALALALAGCGGSAEPTPTGTTCPPQGTTLTWENFAEEFMGDYCTRCHASDRHGDDRHGAPLYHDFDTEFGVVAVGNHVDEWAGAGPDATNQLMPPDGTRPTREERLQLSEYVACQLEHLGDPDAGATAD